MMLAGIAMVILGIRGRIVSGHPHCRGCRFDLSGLQGESCPECGADLRRGGAVRQGLRRKRGVMMALGLALLLPLAAVVTIRVVPSGASLAAWKPVWLLRAELFGSDLAAADVAEMELCARTLRGQLGRANANAIALQIVESSERGSPGDRADMLSSLDAAGLLRDDLLLRDVKSRSEVTAMSRHVAAAGEMLGVRVTLNCGGFVMSPKLRWRALLRPIGQTEWVSVEQEPSETIPEILTEIPAPTSPGEAVIEVGAEVWVASATGVRREGAPLAVIAPFTMPLRVVASLDEIVPSVHDDSLMPLARASLQPPALYFRVDREGATRVRPWFVAEKSRVPWGHDVVMVAGGREIVIGRLTGPPGPTLYAVGDTVIDGPLEGPVVLILRPNRRTGHVDPEVREVWDGELRFEDVPVKPW